MYYNLDLSNELGLVGGTIWHSIGGARNAPSGQRMSQAFSRVKARVPILGGSFAVWGVLFFRM
jgi:import inner membrane translocase subunit TIM17